MIPKHSDTKRIYSPLIASMYLKKAYKDKKGAQPEDVLVVETNSGFDDMEYEARDEYIMELLLDLKDLKDQASKRYGSFDRIDIRPH